MNPAYFVHPDIRRARTLPAAAFTDPDFLRLELETIFRRRWLFVPQRFATDLRDDPRSLADLVSRKGARAPASLLDRPIFLQRDWKGRLHAFPNVCTHAWHTLVQGPDRQKTIVCPQHGRQFDCEGRFLLQPGLDSPCESDHLADLPIRQWGPFFFATLGEPAAPFDDLLAPVVESLGALLPESLARRPIPGEARELDGNWKQHAWNYMDRLHIPFIHRKPGGLADAVELQSYRTELFPHSALQWAYARDPKDGFDPDLIAPRFADPKRRVYALWWFLFPNLALNFYPWGLSINAYMPVPDRPRRTLFLWYHYALDEAKYAERDERWQLRDADAEDVDALTQVVRGAASGFAPRGRFVENEEAGPYWLHRLVYQTILEEKAESEKSGKESLTTRRKK
jgi:choline monooxygenase